MSQSNITFFERFEADILAGKKTITIRDESEKDFAPNSIVQVSTYEEGRWFCALKIHSVHSICFEELSDFHAEQENMTLAELKSVIQAIYPHISSNVSAKPLATKNLYVIKYELIHS